MTTAAHKYLETLQRDAYARIGISEESAIDSLRVATAQVMPEFLKRDDAYRSEMKEELADILRRLVEQRQRAGLAITPRQIAELESDLQHEISRNMPPFTDTAKPSTKFEDPLSTFLYLNGGN